MTSKVTFDSLGEALLGSLTIATAAKVVETKRAAALGLKLTRPDQASLLDAVLEIRLSRGTFQLRLILCSGVDPIMGDFITRRVAWGQFGHLQFHEASETEAFLQEVMRVLQSAMNPERPHYVM